MGEYPRCLVRLREGPQSERLFRHLRRGPVRHVLAGQDLTKTVCRRLSRRCGEEIAQRLDWGVFHDEGLADVARQDQGNAAVADLLVLAHMVEEAVGRD